MIGTLFLVEIVTRNKKKKVDILTYIYFENHHVLVLAHCWYVHIYYIFNIFVPVTLLLRHDDVDPSHAYIYIL